MIKYDKKYAFYMLQYVVVNCDSKTWLFHAAYSASIIFHQNENGFPNEDKYKNFNIVIE